MFHFQYRYWPVGQGVFATGRLFGAGETPFVWVYDCGTLSETFYLDEAIGSFCRDWLGMEQRRIDMLVLSHFDRDHVNGVVRLLETCEVETIVLPYIPLWRRLLLASRIGAKVNDAVFDFFLDPVRFLTSISGSGRIGRIVLVPTSGPSDDSAPSSDLDLPEDPDSGRPRVTRRRLEIDEGGSPTDDDQGPFSPAESPRVVRLKPAGRLSLRGVWEFVPHNDEGMLPRVDEWFRHGADLFCERLLAAEDDQRRQEWLDGLRYHYDRRFGRSSVRRNVISLFLYSGPVGPVELVEWSSSAGVQFPESEARFGQIFCGDGLLNNQSRLEALRRRFSHGRLRRGGLLQVAHHGSRRSWRAGLAADLDPVVSIFCADPLRPPHYHPHETVRDNFADHSPVLVDRFDSFEMSGSFQHVTV